MSILLNYCFPWKKFYLFAWSYFVCVGGIINSFIAGIHMRIHCLRMNNIVMSIVLTSNWPEVFLPAYFIEHVNTFKLHVQMSKKWSILGDWCNIQHFCHSFSWRRERERVKKEGNYESFCCLESINFTHDIWINTVFFHAMNWMPKEYFMHAVVGWWFSR